MASSIQGPRGYAYILVLPADHRSRKSKLGAHSLALLRDGHKAMETAGLTSQYRAENDPFTIGLSNDVLDLGYDLCGRPRDLDRCQIRVVPNVSVVFACLVVLIHKASRLFVFWGISLALDLHRVQ